MVTRKSLTRMAMGRLGASSVLERPQAEPGQPGQNPGSQKPSNTNTLPGLSGLPRIKTHAHEKGTGEGTEQSTDSKSPLNPAANYAKNPGQPGQPGQPIGVAGHLPARVDPGTRAEPGQPGRNPARVPSPDRLEAGLQLILDAYSGATVEIRPATPIPEPPRWPELSETQKRTRRKWLGRDTARFGLVNRDLPREPLLEASAMSDARDDGQACCSTSACCTVTPPACKISQVRRVD
jgi:hypothetical protein